MSNLNNFPLSSDQPSIIDLLASELLESEEEFVCPHCDANIKKQNQRFSTLPK